VNFVQLPDDWPAERDTLRRLAAHVLARSQATVTGHIALTVLPGGFGTPQFGSDRRRVRLAGGSMFVETAAAERSGEAAATTTVHMVAGSTLATLCAAARCTPDDVFSVGDDTPALGDVDETIRLDADSVTVLGDWFHLGQRAIDGCLASLPDPQASVVRLWPEHFDLGVDLAVDQRTRPGVRANLGAAAGDGFHHEPYLYVAPWGAERPGPDGFWNAPFGATLSFGELDAAENPLAMASEFFLHGIAYLRM
jgi:hypothetical protein